MNLHELFLEVQWFHQYKLFTIILLLVLPLLDGYMQWACKQEGKMQLVKVRLISLRHLH